MLHQGLRYSYPSKRIWEKILQSLHLVHHGLILYRFGACWLGLAQTEATVFYAPQQHGVLTWLWIWYSKTKKVTVWCEMASPSEAFTFNCPTRSIKFCFKWTDQSSSEHVLLRRSTDWTGELIFRKPTCRYNELLHYTFC